MSEIDAFQSRIMAAMDRLAAGVEKISPGAAEELDALKAAMAEEKANAAQLAEQVKDLTEQQQAAAAALETQSNEVAARMEALDTDLQRLRAVNTELLSICEALRDANEEGVGEPHLINRAMVAELDAMKAARRSEMAEANEIIAALTPLLSSGDGASKETSNA